MAPLGNTRGMFRKHFTLVPRFVLDNSFSVGARLAAEFG
jgi:hypothetical protein